MRSLSIIITSYNSRDITHKCLLNLQANFNRYPLDYELVVVDNGSSDGSVTMLKKIASDWNNLHLYLSKKNLGYTKGNNLGFSLSSGKYVLFLNSDVLIEDLNFKDLLAFMDRYPDIGVLTVKLMLNQKQIDPASHRGFPTLWRSFCYLVRLEQITSQLPLLNRYFGGYHLIDRDLDTIHEIDSPTGAFFLTRRAIFTRVNGFDEDFFMYGEDLDLSYRIKQLGYRIIYYPLFQALHLKGQSGIYKYQDKAMERRTRFYFYDAWRIFYHKHWAGKNFWWLNQIVYFFIKLKTLPYYEKNRS
jgi:hypothetical protein